MQFPIGIILDSIRKPFSEALALARRVGAEGVQLYATGPALSPQTTPKSQRREFARQISNAGLSITALCGDFGIGFTDPLRNPDLIAASRRILELAVDMGCNIVTTHIGVVPEDSRHPRYAILQDACGELARCADQLQAHFAIETGPETASTLRHFLDGLHSRGVAVNMDPANFVMVTGDDPVQAVKTLAPYLVHTHAKDGVMHYRENPEVIYGIQETPAPVTAPAFDEVPLGQGSVPFPRYLKALEEVGYQGFLTIEREVGDDPAGDIAAAANYLRELMQA